MQGSREAFEEAAFAQRFLHSVKHVGHADLPLQSIGCPTKEEFIKRKPNGHYVDPTLNMLWWAWLKATNHAADLVVEYSVQPVGKALREIILQGIE